MPEIRYTFRGDASQISRVVSQMKQGFKGVEASADDAFNKASRSSRNFSVNLTKAALGVTAAVAGLAALRRAGTAAFAFVTQVTKTQDEIAKLSQRFGVSTETLSGFRLAAELTGTSLQSVAVGLRTAGRNALDASRGTGEAKESFDELGIAVTDSQGRLKTADRLIFEVAQRFHGMDDAARKAALAQDIFGRSGSDLVPLLNQGSSGIQAMIEDARRLGIVFDAEAAAKAEAFNDSVTRLGSALDGLKFRAIGPLLPLLTDAVNAMTEGATVGEGFSKTIVGMARVSVSAAIALVQLSRATLQFGEDAVEAGLSVLRIQKGLLDVARLAPGVGAVADAIGGNLNERIKEGEQLSGLLASGAERTGGQLLSLARIALKLDKTLLSIGRTGASVVDKPPFNPPPNALVNWKALNEELEKALMLGREAATVAIEGAGPPIAPGAGQDIGTLGATGLAGVTFGGSGGPTEEGIVAAGIPGAEQLSASLVQPFIDAAAAQDEAFSGITARSNQFLQEWGAIANQTIDVAQIITGGVGQAFVGLGRALAGGGEGALRGLAQMGAQLLAQIGSIMLSQGIAEIVMGHAPPPFGPRPDLIAHGTVMTAVGAGLAVAGGFLGAVAGGGGGGAGGGFGGGGGGFGGSPFAASGPEPIDVSSISQGQVGEGLAASIDGLNAQVSRIREFQAKSVVGMASRQSPTLIRGRAAGEIPPTG